jgi:hypothetical protein
MRRNLVAEKVEVDPTGALSSDSTTEDVNVELPCCWQVGDRKG